MWRVVLTVLLGGVPTEIHVLIHNSPKFEFEEYGPYMLLSRCSDAMMFVKVSAMIDGERLKCHDAPQTI